MPRFRALLPAFLILLLPFAAAAQTISGVVTNGATGAPLVSMKAAAYKADGTVISATTDATGRYSLQVPAGTYRVLAYDPSGVYATQFNGDAPSFEESPETVVSATQPAVVNFQLRVGGKVTGSVTTSGGVGRSMTVAAYNLSGTRRGLTTTDSNGNYSIVLPSGMYKIAAYDDAGAFAPSFFADRNTFAAADVVTVNAGQTTASITFFLQLGARFLGVVTNASGSPIANAVVLAYNAAGVQITFAIAASDGTFTMTVLPGTYRFVAIDPAYIYAAGFLSGAKSFESSPAIQVTAGQMRSDLVFRLDPGGQVAGTVVDSVTGAGIRNITVAAYNNDGTQRTFVTTDANGKFVLLLPPGSFRIAAFDSALVYATQFYPQASSFAGSMVITASPGQTVTLQPFTLTHGGHFTGTVTDRIGGAAVSGIVVAAYDESGNLVTTASTATDGKYRMVVPAGWYRLIAFDPQLRYAPAFAGGAANFVAISPVRVSTDAVMPIDFTLNRGTLVNGSVVDRLHAPVSDVFVTALDLGENPVATAISSSDGSFKLSLLPGKYKFLLVDPNGRYGTTYLGGQTFASATTITVEAATSLPRITLLPLPKRRSVQH